LIKERQVRRRLLVLYEAFFLASRVILSVAANQSFASPILSKWALAQRNPPTSSSYHLGMTQKR
jgi:hypothetical protein